MTTIRLYDERELDTAVLEPAWHEDGHGHRQPTKLLGCAGCGEEAGEPSYLLDEPYISHGRRRIRRIPYRLTRHLTDCPRPGLATCLVCQKVRGYGRPRSAQRTNANGNGKSAPPVRPPWQALRSAISHRRVGE